MKIQREDTAVILTKYVYLLRYFCMLRATLSCALSMMEERFREEAVIDEGLQFELGPELS